MADTIFVTIQILESTSEQVDLRLLLSPEKL